MLAAGTVLLVAALLISGIRPHDRATWLLEVFPVVVALPLIWATWRSFPLTTLLYVCVFVHSLVLIIGGAYTYARVPLGFQIAELLHLERNPYDKIGHFLQGFTPALVAREILLRGGHVRDGKMLGFIAVCIALAVSAVYEMLEWAAALALGQGADDFLGTQGDVWDTQSDMFMALLGASSALAFFSRLHNRQIGRHG
jgi:putative membrane protein